MTSEAKPTKEQLDEWHQDPGNWKLGVFYFNKKDKRILPPKRIKYLGWTVNFANPISIQVLIGIFVLILLLSMYLK